MYLDDMKISEITPAQGLSILQGQFDAICTWKSNNNMMLNPKKYKELPASFHRNNE